MTEHIRHGFTEVHPDTLEEISFRDGSTIELFEGRAYVVTVEGYRYTARIDAAA